MLSTNCRVCCCSGVGLVMIGDIGLFVWLTKLNGALEASFGGRESSCLVDDEHVQQKNDKRNDAEDEQLGDPRPDRPQRTTTAFQHLIAATSSLAKLIETDGRAI